MKHWKRRAGFRGKYQKISEDRNYQDFISSDLTEEMMRTEIIC